jgi:hypothetical protein
LRKCSIPFDTRKTKVYVDLFVLVPTSQRIIHGFFYKIKKTKHGEMTRRHGNINLGEMIQK